MGNIYRYDDMKNSYKCEHKNESLCSIWALSRIWDVFKKKIAAYFQPTCSRKVSVKFSIIGEITTLTFKMIENWVKALHDTLLNRRSRITFNLLM